MAAVYQQNGKYIDYTATSDIGYLDIVVIKDRIGVAETALKAGETGTAAVVGVYVLPAKAGVAIEQGAVVYWNTTDNVIDTSSANAISAGWAFQSKSSAGTEIAVKIG